MSNEWIFYSACGLAGAIALAASTGIIKLKSHQNGGKKTRHINHKRGKNTRRK